VPSSGSGHARARFLLVFGALVFLQAWRLLCTPYGLASTWTRTSSDLVVVSADGRGVVQDFVMGADGLDGIWVRPRPSSRPLTGQVVLTLGEVGRDGAAPLLRQARDARAFDTSRPVRLDVPEIRDARGRRFRMGLMHVGHEGDAVLRLHARRGDALPGAGFTVDGVEQWGDLLFETSARRATLPYWKHEVLGAWPAWGQSWWFIVGVLVAGNVLLARACAVVATRAATSVTEVGAAPGTPPGAPRRAAMLAGLVVAAGGLAVVMMPTPTHRVIRLIDSLGHARIETSARGLHEGIDVQAVGILGRAYQAIVALPPSRLAWTVEVPKGALLLGDAAMRPDVWDKEGDGANLTVSVESAAARTEVARFTLAPYLYWHHRDRHPMRVSLDPWAGQTITLVFETDPERWGNAVNDVPLWVNPRIEWPHGPAWGEARLR
jgi:hypothetical protein